MSRTYSDNKRPVEAFGSDFSSMGVYPTVADAAAEDAYNGETYV